MTCPACGDKPQKAACGFPKAVIEIDNAEQINLFRKVVVPTSMGDDTDIPPEIGKYRNVLLNYEANNHTYLYSSDGIPTLLTSDVAETIEQRVKNLEVTLADEIDAREKADDDLKTLIDTKADIDSLATVATTGDYADLINKPTIGDATLTIQRNSTDVGTFTANSTADATIDISVPTTPADIGAQAEITSDNKLDADLVDDTNSTNKFVTASDLSKISTALQPADIDKVVMTDIDVSGNTSTTTVALEAAKENLMSGAQTTKSIALPVASSTEAGVMNSSTFDAVTANTNNINALLNGAVAVTGLSANPSQSDITTAWQTETGLTTLINRASVYDVTNDKVWTYYTNDNTWHAASNTAQVTINTFTNSSEGTIKGSTNTGQVFAENDGTGSVNGWDALNAQVSDNTNNIGTLQTAITNKQDKLTAGANITISSNTISATDTKYTAGTGLTLAGTQFSADTSVLQEKLTAGNAIDITSNVISADVYPADFFTAGATVTDTDSNITLNNTIPATLKDIKLYGDTFQQTYTGKNLMPMKVSDNTTSRVNNFKISLPAGTYTVSFDLSDIVLGSNQSFNIQMSIAGAISGGGNYDGNITGTISSTTSTHKSFTFTTTADSNVSVDSNIRIPQTYWDNGARAKLSNIQIEAGSTATPFEPYTGGIPAPNPDYPQDIHVATGEQTVRVSGKNLWKPAPDGTSTQGGITSVRENGVITLTGTSTSTSAGTSNFYDLDTPFPAGTYTFSIPNPLPYRFEFVMQDSNGTNHFPVIPAGSTSGTITTTWETVKIRNGIGGYSVGTEINLTIEELQLEEGSTATTYQPYQTQSYEINLGKNLFDKNSLSDGWFDTNGSISQDSSWKHTDYIPITPSTPYTTSGFANGSGVNPARCYYDANKVFISGVKHNNAAQFADTSPSNARYMRECCKTVDVDTLQIEVGSTATPYAPYFTPIELCKIGNYQDYIYKSGDDWYVHKEVGKITYTGDSSEDWLYSGTSGGPFRISVPNSKYYIDNYTPPLVFTNYYTPINWSGISSTTYAVTAFNNNVLPFRNTDITSLDAWKAWLGSHNMTVYYPFATPTDTKITNADLIADLNALAEAKSYLDTTYFIVTAVSPNLPVLLNPTAYRMSSDGIAEMLTTIPEAQIQSDWAQVDATAVDYIKNKPTLATVATTGDYDDLVDKPALATVATSGSYADLTNKPTIPAAQVNSDWNSNSGVSKILNKPTLATVATSGSYSDLTNKPTIPAAQIQSNWTQTNTVAKDYIKNKPTLAAVATSGSYADLTGTPSLSTVATSGSYDDLTDKPTIPTVNNATLTIQQNGTNVATFTANSSTNATANITAPVITMQTTDPGEGAPLAANNFIAVYNA